MNVKPLNLFDNFPEFSVRDTRCRFNNCSLLHFCRNDLPDALLAQTSIGFSHDLIWFTHRLLFGGRSGIRLLAQHCIQPSDFATYYAKFAWLFEVAALLCVLNPKVKALLLKLTLP
jgi:hypothetical protein